MPASHLHQPYTAHTHYFVKHKGEQKYPIRKTEKRCKKSEQVGVHLIYSAHFLPPTCVQPQDASGHNYSEDPSLKCTNPEPGAAAVVDVFASESSQGNGHHLLSLNRALWMMIVNWPNSAPRCNRDNKDNGPVTGGHCSAPA